jgi:hypothetical protein
MKAIKFSVAAVIGSLLLAGAGCKKSDNSNDIDGKWVGSDLSNPGAQCEIIVSKGNFEFHGTNETDSFKGTIAVFYTESQPGAMDVNVKEPQQLAGKTALFIFERKGNELKLAWERPGTFRRPSTLNPEQGVRIATLKRQ